MANNQLMGSTVMTPAERKKIAEQQKARQKEREKIKNERATASEFGAAMSPTASKDDKARAAIRSNPKDIRFAGTKQTQRVKDAGEKVAAKQRAEAAKQRAMDATAAKRKITQADTTKPKNAALKKPAANTKPAASGKVSFGTAFSNARKAGMKTFTWNGKKYTTEVAKAKPKARVNTPLPADFIMTGKKPDISAKTKARNLTLRDKEGVDAKKIRRREERPVTGPGSQSKTLRPKPTPDPIPAGAKKFTGKFNSKTHTLRKIKGRPGMYLIPRKKAK